MLEQAVRNNVSGATVVDSQCMSTSTLGVIAKSADEQHEDFFSFTAETAPESRIQNLQFLNDSDKELIMLNRHPEIKKIFLRYNTTLPSSALVERLFSTAALILTKRRNKLHDNIFETLLLMKLNRDYW